MADLIFRAAVRDDVPVILDLYDGGRLPRPGEPEPSEAAYLAAFEAIDADPRNELIIAELDGEIVGTFQLTYIPSLSRRGVERVTIEGVHVRADRRGQGLGRRMMAWALDRARARGCGLAQLTSDKRRTDAHRFYASLGFHATHEGFKIIL
ncbi:GNAT family acetyltransferase [Actinoplanes sp. NBRC 14428]|uniref:Putative N-acetyltransferase YhbS n=1 Tax=Pseudosporangium ferrugineum TaxID=439699 RepID=A0A2T0RU07_9ACTN|nr:GNAT family N-acetyltransferase [Pseudosporangium ferrugineum]PRY24689.1 putative N-acetyltransferase YhbS [Pseudosporangium ferrugineum]BCJ54939.1 GNAT family acetyltransferase [Actinoplanes sp. NBRC 14428]